MPKRRFGSQQLRRLSQLSHGEGPAKPPLLNFLCRGRVHGLIHVSVERGARPCKQVGTNTATEAPKIREIMHSSAIGWGKTPAGG